MTQLNVYQQAAADIRAAGGEGFIRFTPCDLERVDQRHQIEVGRFGIVHGSTLASAVDAAKELVSGKPSPAAAATVPAPASAAEPAVKKK